jgi:hypothetical protein
MLLPDHQRATEEIYVGVGNCLLVRLSDQLRTNGVDPRNQTDRD